MSAACRRTDGEVEAFKSSGLDVVKREEEVLELVEQHKMVRSANACSDCASVSPHVPRLPPQLVHLSELCITSARQESDAEKLKAPPPLTSTSRSPGPSLVHH